MQLQIEGGHFNTVKLLVEAATIQKADVDAANPPEIIVEKLVKRSKLSTFGSD